jgi:hypothetical protein
MELKNPFPQPRFFSGRMPAFYILPALLKSSENIEHLLIFEETIDGKNDTFQFDFLYLLSIRSRVDGLSKESFQDRKNRFGHIPMAINFEVERTCHDLSVFARNI